jgi:hypothetical protein
MSTPARYWRAIVRDGMPQVTGDDRAFLCYLRQNLPGSEGLERFVLAVGLLTFGQLEALDAILADTPAVGHPARLLARAVDDLLSTGGNVLADPAAIRQWVAEHRDGLVWVEERGVFQLAEGPAGN